jgi:hypothetical protein
MYIDQLMNARQAMDWGMRRAQDIVIPLMRCLQVSAVWALCLTI